MSAIRVFELGPQYSRSHLQNTELWLTDDELGFTDERGTTVSCPRAAVVSALRLITTIRGESQDLLVFFDGGDKPLLDIPLGLWNANDIDELTSLLGIGTALRKYVNSERELAAIAPGIKRPRHLSTRKYLGLSPREWSIYSGTLVITLVAAAIVISLVLVLDHILFNHR